MDEEQKQPETLSLITTQIFRLSTGEDIITDCMMEKTHVIIFDPYRLVYFTTAPNSQSFQVSMFPWIFHSVTKNREFVLMPRDIITYAEPSDKMLALYLKCKVQEQEMDKKLPPVDMTPEEEITMMDNNEERIQEGDFLNMIKDKLNSLNKKTLH